MNFTTDQYLEIYNLMNSQQRDALSNINQDNSFDLAYRYAQSLDFHQWKTIMCGDLEDIPAIKLQFKELEAL
jgi:hypothetical protein